jgi:4-aminobutyrate aminotransferase
VLYLALERGLSFKVSMGNVLTLSPSLVVTADQMHQALDILHQVLTRVENRLATTRTE